MNCSNTKLREVENIKKGLCLVVDYIVMAEDDDEDTSNIKVPKWGANAEKSTKILGCLQVYSPDVLPKQTRK